MTKLMLIDQHDA